MSATGVEMNRTSINLPSEVSSEILQKTQEDSAVMQLARKVTLPGRGLTIPMITSDPEAAWVGETSKNSKYFKEQCESIAGSLVSVLKPKGTCLFANLPSIASSQPGDMWNIEDEFVTTSDFREGAGKFVSAGANVYLTVDSKWDVLAGEFPADMTGATATTDGTHGLIKQPHAGDQDKFFRGDGTWANVIDTIYPINSVYISMVDVNPGTFWTGTTWDKLSDGYLRNNATDATGGSLTSGETVLTADQIPSHSHTFTTGSGGAHTHTATTGSYGAHTHTAKTGSYGAHTHALQLKDGRFSNEYKHISEVIASGSVSRAFVEHWSESNNNILIAGSAGAHTHTLTTGSYGAHTHTLTTGSYGSHTHTGTTEAKGGGQGHTHSIEPPYVRIYAFKRTA